MPKGILTPGKVRRAYGSGARQDVVFYRGPSALGRSGGTILGIVTGLRVSSGNPKTGPMAQVWILREDVPPMDAKRQNLDDAVCGNCKLRGHSGRGSICYVPAWMGPMNVWKAYHRGKYAVRTALEAAETDLSGVHLRVSAYGDPAALPFELWPDLLSHVAGWVGYTHQWATCDPRFRSILMASVDSVDEHLEAARQGWRTFRIRGPREPLQTGFRRLALNEFACPASDEMGHRTTCQACQLCRGTSSPARHVAIVAHGNNSAQVNFYREHPEHGARPLLAGRPTIIVPSWLGARLPGGSAPI